MNWSDKDLVRAYKAGYMRGLRVRNYKTNEKATDLARLVMLNEMERSTKYRRRYRTPRIVKDTSRLNSQRWRGLESRDLA